jgi:hypothetical protein
VRLDPGADAVRQQRLAGGCRGRRPRQVRAARGGGLAGRAARGGGPPPDGPGGRAPDGFLRGLPGAAVQPRAWICGGAHALVGLPAMCSELCQPSRARVWKHQRFPVSSSSPIFYTIRSSRSTKRIAANGRRLIGGARACPGPRPVDGAGRGGGRPCRRRAAARLHLAHPAARGHDHDDARRRAPSSRSPRQAR